VEFKAGHIPGALNIDVNSPDFDKKIGELDKHKAYLVHCAAGSRSARACKKLERLGFQDLFDLRPGFNGWEEAGKPVEK
jgi:rhodanese-related sulfurtransferase